MKRPALVWLGFLIVLAMGVGISACAAPPPPVEFTVSILSGGGSIQHDGTWQPLVDRTKLSGDFSLKANLMSYVLLQFSGDSMIQLAPGTELALNQAGGIRLKLVTGMVSVVSKNTPVMVRADSADASSTTAVSFSVERAESGSVLKVVSGAVNFSASGSTVQVPDGQMSIANSGPPSRPEPVTLREQDLAPDTRSFG